MLGFKITDLPADGAAVQQSFRGMLHDEGIEVPGIGIGAEVGIDTVKLGLSGDLVDGAGINRIAADQVKLDEGSELMTQQQAVKEAQYAAAAL